VETNAPNGREMSPLGRAVVFLFSPSKVFTSLRYRCGWQDWFFPLAIVILASVISGQLTFPAMMADQTESILSNQNIPDERKDEMLRTLPEKENFSRVMMGVLTPVGILMVVLVIALVLQFGVNAILGGDLLYRESLSVVCYSSLVSIPAYIVKVPLMIVKGTVKGVRTDFSLLLPSGSADSLAYKLLSRFDLFMIWEIALLSIGLGIVSEIPKRRTGGLVIALWALWIIISIVLGRTFRSLS